MIAPIAPPGQRAFDAATRNPMVAPETLRATLKNSEYGDFPVRVEKVEPPTYLAYRWARAFPGVEPGEGNSTPDRRLAHIKRVAEAAERDAY
ncbi:hypothetical protein ACPXCP_06605 [Streptomyces sp. DT20]|uniref:hypothetical protein n=1 Tax=Streptomyces sp. DT20 TaxID=3416519 RepID=UPI003CE68967